MECALWSAERAVARAQDATVNDVLVTCLAGSLHSYLRDRDRSCASTTWMIPVNLKPLDLELPEELGNEFAIVQLELPTAIADPLSVLDVVRHRMRRIKYGHEAGLAFRLQELISGFNPDVYRVTVDLHPGEVVGLLGHNGAGKSTLIKLLLGLLTPTRGRIQVLGLDPTADTAAVRARVGYMPEHDCLPNDISASDFVNHMARMSGLPRASAPRETLHRPPATGWWTMATAARQWSVRHGHCFQDPAGWLCGHP